jgi:hypothetical protein
LSISVRDGARVTPYYDDGQETMSAPMPIRNGYVHNGVRVGLLIVRINGADLWDALTHMHLSFWRNGWWEKWRWELMLGPLDIRWKWSEKATGKAMGGPVHGCTVRGCVKLAIAINDPAICVECRRLCAESVRNWVWWRRLLRWIAR